VFVIHFAHKLSSPNYRESTQPQPKIQSYGLKLGISDFRFYFCKRSKIHLRASPISKLLPGVIGLHPDRRDKGERRGGEGMGWAVISVHSTPPDFGGGETGQPGGVC
jgi:hypothetical protein